MISIFLPSYNKGGFAVEAVRSVFAQSYQDWELWLLENSTDDGRTRKLLEKFTDLDDRRVHYLKLEVAPEIRENYTAVACLLNEFYPRANGDIILYLSDDDLFMPGIFQAVADHFAGNPDHNALYFPLARTAANNPGEGKMWGERFMSISATILRGSSQVDCIIDGGQVAYRTAVLGRLSQPYFYTGKDSETACHADGLHLEAVTQTGVTFHPLNVPGVIHRHTPASVWSKDR